MSLFTNTKIPLLGKALEAYSLRQKVIGANIANMTTTGYHARSVTFGEELDNAMQQQPVMLAQTDELHMGGTDESGVSGELKVVEQRSEQAVDPMASGYNDVNIDHEMSELAKNQIRFKYAARLLSETFKGIQKSIRGTQ